MVRRLILIPPEHLDPDGGTYTNLGPYWTLKSLSSKSSVVDLLKPENLEAFMSATSLQNTKQIYGRANILWYAPRLEWPTIVGDLMVLQLYLFKGTKYQFWMGSFFRPLYWLGFVWLVGAPRKIQIYLFQSTWRRILTRESYLILNNFLSDEVPCILFYLVFSP